MAFQRRKVLSYDAVASNSGRAWRNTLTDFLYYHLVGFGAHYISWPVFHVYRAILPENHKHQGALFILLSVKAL